jgi:DNA invertase Pin-like site-specific DNA recombinase
MENIIIYTRVRNNDQAVVDSDIKKQIAICSQYCNMKKYNIVASFKENPSAKSFKRPEWNKIMELVKKDGDSINKIVFTHWNRFSRNQFEVISTIKALEKLNVEVECVEQPLDLSIPENLLLLNIYFTIPKIENKHN